MSFDTALAFVLKWEGGFSCDPADPGGATMKGITQTTANRWAAENDLPSIPVQYITDQEVHDIYRSLYWQVAHCDALPENLATVQFDTAVQRGPGNAVRMLQGALGVTVDGQFGPATLKAVQACEEKGTVARYLAARAQHYADEVARRPASARFLKGWMNRLDALRRAVA